MKRILAALALVLALTSGCDPPEDDSPKGGLSPVPAQNVMTQMTIDAGYEVAGIPQFAATHWTSNVRIVGCTADITVAAPDAPATEAPKSFRVIDVAGTPFAELSPGTDATNLKAQTLKALPGMSERLGCK